jgi:hypothetical protein
MTESVSNSGNEGSDENDVRRSDNDEVSVSFFLLNPPFFKFLFGRSACAN